MPIEYLALRGSASMSKPQMLADPAVLLTSPARWDWQAATNSSLVSYSGASLAPKATIALTQFFMFLSLKAMYSLPSIEAVWDTVPLGFWIASGDKIWTANVDIGEPDDLDGSSDTLVTSTR